MPFNKNEWQELDSPGYLGKRRDERFAEYDQRFGGRENWSLAWKVNGLLFNQEEACLLYGEAYYEFFRHNWPFMEQLIKEARDVYDDEPSNVNSGLDYSKQETVRTHLQDIAIRRALILHGKWFQGNKLIRIRQEKGDHPLSIKLSPGRVPFHKPGVLARPSLAEKVEAVSKKPWWEFSSVEDFYQSNRVVVSRI